MLATEDYLNVLARFYDFLTNGYGGMVNGRVQGECS
jgi:hypothetical protein